ncbi:hypothetical protein [Psychrobacter alimentarius]|uniref:hypothetical protein n=1 Tax=Psychrobacter alimentarius TaxID=261164 RepID=UPI003FD2B64C
MSVMGMVDNAQGSEEEFSFPISFERVYRDYWYKFANEKELYWLKFFLYGIEVERANFNQVRIELQLFKDFLLNGGDFYYLSERKYILSRIELFLEKLDEAESFRDDIVLYIG